MEMSEFSENNLPKKYYFLFVCSFPLMSSIDKTFLKVSIFDNETAVSYSFSNPSDKE